MNEECKPSISLPVPAADCSPTSSSDIPQSEQLSLIHTAAPSCESAPPTDGSPDCKCTRETFGCSIHPATPAAWIASMQDSLASLIRSQESELAKLTNVISGRTPGGSLAEYDRDSSCWKTCQASFLTDTPPLSSENFPRWGMTRAGRFYPLPMLALRTCASGGGALQNVPTPMVADAKKHSPAESGGNSGKNLVRYSLGLMWPTPQTTDYKGSVSKQKAKERSDHPRGKRLPEEMTLRDDVDVGGKLNPTWVEWLMGWPLAWTALKPSATAKSRSQRRSRGISSEDQ